MMFLRRLSFSVLLKTIFKYEVGIWIKSDKIFALHNTFIVLHTINDKYSPCYATIRWISYHVIPASKCDT